MNLLREARPSMCAHCGEHWSAESAANREFCPRCGGPVFHAQFDPFKARFFGCSHRLNTRTKLVVRAGIVVIGLVSALCGFLLCYGGWFDPQNMDIVQVWISRLGGPALLAQGVIYSWLPFRNPRMAEVISINSARRA